MNSRLQERPPAFVYGSARPGLLRRPAPTLHVEEVPLPRLAERFGTPLYVYSTTAIRARVAAFQHAFAGHPHTLCYSVKANSNLSILRLLAGLDCGFDVVSGGELERVLRADRGAAKRVVFSGVGKTAEEMEAALRAGIPLFNVESESELARLAEAAARLKRRANIAMRVNPDVSARTHPYISTGLHRHKFGIPMKDARALYARVSMAKSLRVAGISVHIGSQISDVAPFTQALEKVRTLVEQLTDDGHAIEFIDAGGGLGISYEKGDQNFPAQIRKYAEAVLGPLRGLKAHLLLEPGRAIIGPAGALLTRVLYRKTNDGKRFVVVDAAMNDLLRPSLYEAYHEIVPVVDRQRPREVVDIVGPICESGDFFAREREMPAATEGDLLAILDAGAYGMALASNYNTRPRPAEVLVEGKSAKVIRRRETVGDLLRAEK